MKKQTTQIAKRSLFSFGAALLIMLFASISSVNAQTTPPAGTLIGNQATATFNDAGGNPRTVTSNVVNTQVSQIAALTITASQSKTVSPGGQLAFPHTVTNNGNGTDRFNLTTVSTSADFAFSSINIYEDLDGNGVPDNFTPITQTTNIAAGVSFNFVVVVTIPSSALNTQDETVTITATSIFDNTKTQSNTDTATVSDNAVINVTKSMSANTGIPGSGPYTVTLTYTNSGNAIATGFVVSDALPANMVYVAGTARWSVSGATALSDASDGPEAANALINYDYAAGSTTLTAQISTVAPGQSGTVTFQVNISGAALPGTINNTAVYSYNDGAAQTGNFNSNTYIFTVLPTAGVSGTGETIANSTQGSTVVFTNVVTNNGNVTDKFNISIVSNSFPVGSSYILYKSDGLSPLLDTNSDGIPDTGPLAAGATYDVVLKVTLPNSANGGGPYVIVKRATSINDPSKTADMNDELTTITGNTVDVTVDKDIATDNATLAEGLGAGPEGTSRKTNSTNPGTTTRFTLYVNNTSAVSDNFDLATSTDQTFASIVVPNGVVVTFRDVAELVISNTGTVLAGGRKLVYMDVTIPANKTAVTAESYYFRAVSPATAAADRIHLGITVNTIRDMALSPNNSGQVFPGGSVTYNHTITNNGNVTENGSGTEFAMSIANSNGGFSAVIYIDINSDGLIDAGDVLVGGSTNFGAFAPGVSKQVIVKVTATPGVTEGLINTSTLSATLTGTVNSINAPTITSATDVTTVINSNVTLVKTQSLDIDGNGVADGAYISTQVSAKPGEGVVYRIIVTNLGTTTVTSVQINDAIPSYTTYNSTVAVSSTKGTASYSAGTKTVTVAIGDLAAGESATIVFGVLIDN